MALLKGARGPGDDKQAGGRQSRGGRGGNAQTGVKGGVQKSSGGRGRGSGQGQGGRGRGRGGNQGRGGGRGRGRSRGRDGKKPTVEDLDAEMDDYFLKDKKTASHKLDADLDSYMAGKGKDTKPTAGAAAQPVAAAGPAQAAAGTDEAEPME